MENKDFIKQLQKEAQKQAILHENRILPRQLDAITAFVGNYPWQVITILSLVTAMAIWIL